MAEVKLTRAHAEHLWKRGWSLGSPPYSELAETVVALFDKIEEALVGDENTIDMLAEDALFCTQAMRAYFQFGESMNWGGLEPAEAIVIRNKLVRTTERIEAKLLER